MMYIYSHSEKKPAFFIPFWAQFGIAIGKSVWYNERATGQYTTTQCCCHPAGHQAQLGVFSPVFLVSFAHTRKVIYETTYKTYDTPLSLPPSSAWCHTDQGCTATARSVSQPYS